MITAVVAMIPWRTAADADGDGDAVAVASSSSSAVNGLESVYRIGLVVRSFLLCARNPDGSIQTQTPIRLPATQIVATEVRILHSQWLSFLLAMERTQGTELPARYRTCCTLASDGDATQNRAGWLVGWLAGVSCRALCVFESVRDGTVASRIGFFAVLFRSVLFVPCNGMQ